MEEILKSHSLLYFSAPGCVECDRLQDWLETNHPESNCQKINIAQLDDPLELKDELKEHTRHTQFPFCFVEGKFVPSVSEFKSIINKSALALVEDF
jgi:glutaredoxin